MPSYIKYKCPLLHNCASPVPILLYSNYDFISIYCFLVIMEMLVKVEQLGIVISISFSLLYFLGHFLNFIFQPSYWFFFLFWYILWITKFLSLFSTYVFFYSSLFCHVEAMASLRSLRVFKLDLWVSVLEALLFSIYFIFILSPKFLLSICMLGSPSC